MLETLWHNQKKVFLLPKSCILPLPEVTMMYEVCPQKVFSWCVDGSSKHERQDLEVQGGFLSVIWTGSVYKQSMCQRWCEMKDVCLVYRMESYKISVDYMIGTVSAWSEVVVIMSTASMPCTRSAGLNALVQTFNCFCTDRPCLSKGRSSIVALFKLLFLE